MNDDERLGFFYEIFDSTLPRQGPGDDSSTERAFARLAEAGLGCGTGSGVETEPGGAAASGGATAGEGATAAPGELRILDVGCGTGAQTLVLAQQAGANVVAVDNHQPFLDALQGHAQAAGLTGRIHTRLQDMNHMDVSALGGPFDVVWAEGSLYVMGFGEGLRACRRLLKPGGFLAASELVWLRPDPPEECRAFFATEYPPMSDVAGNLSLLAGSGYRPVAHFVLPERAWWFAYYEPLASRVRELRATYTGDPEKLEMLSSIETEIDVYRRFSTYYGYVFLLARSDDADV